MYNIYTMLDQRPRRWATLYKCYTNVLCLLGKPSDRSSTVGPRLVHWAIVADCGPKLSRYLTVAYRHRRREFERPVRPSRACGGSPQYSVKSLSSGDRIETGQGGGQECLQDEAHYIHCIEGLNVFIEWMLNVGQGRSDVSGYFNLLK